MHLINSKICYSDMHFSQVKWCNMLTKLSPYIKQHWKGNGCDEMLACLNKDIIHISLKGNPLLKIRRVTSFCLPRYVFLNVTAHDGSHHHGHRLRGREPVGVVISLWEVTNIVQVAEKIWHCAELPEATSWGTWGKKKNYMDDSSWLFKPIFFLWQLFDIGRVC